MSGAARPEVFLARQPIFDAYRRVDAYELLYRASAENRYSGADGNVATTSLMRNAFLSVGIDQVTAGKLAFINFPRELLLDDVALALPPERVAVEVLEDVSPDAEVLAAVRRLKDAGYTIALDDFTRLSEEYDALLELADVVKVDFRAATSEQRRELAARLVARGPCLLAEKVENEREFVEAVELGYRYFQGYYFAAPQMVSARDVPAFKANYLRLLAAIQAPDLDLDEVEQLVKAEAALVHWLLKRVNSAAFGFRAQLNSIRHALVVMGERELRKWVSVFCLSGMGEDRPRELLVRAFVRACFCERLAARGELAPRKTDAFLLGMFSLLDAILGRPLAEALAGLPLAAEVRGALLDGSGALAPVLECAGAYARADWGRVRDRATALKLPDGSVLEAYVEAVSGAEQIFGESGEDARATAKEA